MYFNNNFIYVVASFATLNGPLYKKNGCMVSHIILCDSNLAIITYNNLYFIKFTGELWNEKVEGTVYVPGGRADPAGTNLAVHQPGDCTVG